MSVDGGWMSNLRRTDVVRVRRSDKLGQKDLIKPGLAKSVSQSVSQEKWKEGNSERWVIHHHQALNTFPPGAPSVTSASALEAQPRGIMGQASKQAPLSGSRDRTHFLHGTRIIVVIGRWKSYISGFSGKSVVLCNSGQN